MMKGHRLKDQKPSYLKKLEHFYLLRWKNDLENLNDTGSKLNEVREALKIQEKMLEDLWYQFHEAESPTNFPKDAEPLNSIEDSYL